MSASLNVYADSQTFAARLNEPLMAIGLTVGFDFEDIPVGVDHQKQIDDGIEKADGFLFIISPHSVNSPYGTLVEQLVVFGEYLFSIGRTSYDIFRGQS